MPITRDHGFGGIHKEFGVWLNLKNYRELGYNYLLSRVHSCFLAVTHFFAGTTCKNNRIRISVAGSRTNPAPVPVSCRVDMGILPKMASPSNTQLTSTYLVHTTLSHLLNRYGT